MKKLKLNLRKSASTIITLLVLSACESQASLNEKLAIAAGKGKAQKAGEYLKQGAKIDYIYKGRPVLSYAIESGSPETLNVLLEAGADPAQNRSLNDTDNNDNKEENRQQKTVGRPVLFEAADQPDMLKVFIEHETDLNITDTDGKNILFYLQGEDLEQVAPLLKEADQINPDLKNNDGETVLTAAAAEQNTARIRRLLQAGAHAGSRNSRGLSPLDIAWQNKDYKTVKLLLAYGAVNRAADRILQRAAKNGSLSQVKYALQYGARINIEDREGLTPTTYAFQNKRRKVFDYLVNKGGYNPLANKKLIEAVEAENTAAAREALSYGADVNARREKDDATGLIIAASQNDIDTVKLLVSNNANINARDEDGYSALLWSAQQNNLDQLLYLVNKGAYKDIKNNAGYTPLIAAAAFGYLDIVKILVDAKADVNAATASGGTAAYWAALKDYTQIVQILVEAGAIDPANQKALALAAQKGDLDAAKNAIAAGIDINMRDDKGYSPLFYAVNGGHLKMAEVLIEEGGNVNVQDANGYSPLMIAAWNNDLKMMRLLLKNNAATDLRHKSGRTSLMIAAWKASAEAVDMLLSAGAAVNRKDNDSWTALMFSVTENAPESQQKAGLLLRKGADRSLKNNDGATAGEIAVEAGKKGLL